MSQITSRGSKWYKRIYVHIENPSLEVGGLRLVPLVLLHDGRPGYIVNQWIYFLLQEEITDSKLEECIRALEHLYAFTMARHESGELSREQREGLLVGFIDAKKYGTDEFCKTSKKYLQYLKTLGLRWKKNSVENITRYINGINEFDSWQAKFHAAVRLNQSEKRFMTAWEIYQDFKNRTDWDPLVHLHPTREHEKEVHHMNAEPKYRHARLKKKPKTAKGFPMAHILKLFECARNPRDELLLLLGLGGSLRKSEPLHLLRTDIESMNSWGELQVRLADPITGRTEWPGPDGKTRYGERKDYF